MPKTTKKSDNQKLKMVSYFKASIKSKSQARGTKVEAQDSWSVTGSSMMDSGHLYCELSNTYTYAGAPRHLLCLEYI
jgi:hypothetical protein